MKEKRKVYIAGKITGNRFYKIGFAFMRLKLLLKFGIKNAVMNPAKMESGFTWQEYMNVCYKMIDACDCLIMLKDWKDSKGAKLEYEYAKEKGKAIFDYKGNCLHQVTKQR